MILRIGREVLGKYFPPIIRKQEGQARPRSLHRCTPTWDTGQGQSKQPSVRPLNLNLYKNPLCNEEQGDQGCIVIMLRKRTLLLFTSLYLCNAWFLRDDASPTKLPAAS